ncbi:MAG: ABC transporter ATP-binding protein [Anaerolineales bacterium]|nr:ABC transporter ATP-binding protein [Anaerolineales bacterium]
MTEYAVELRNISKRFPGPSGEIVAAVKDVTLHIRDGEFFSLLGPSGCGKTTSLRMIAGFELPTEGEVYIHGKPMGRTPAFQRPVNTVFQQYALFPHLTIGENVAFGLEMKHTAKPDLTRRVQEALHMVRLSNMEKRRPKQLSGGQQQRIALARALVNRPEVLLLDEPLGALDLKLRKEMQLELKTLQREVGITFIYVTHDQEEALTMSDRIAVMSQGVALQVGPPGEIYEQPNCKFVANFIGETNILEGTLVGRDDAGAQVQVAEGLTISAAPPADPAPARGTVVSVVIRPEKLHLQGRPADHNHLPGTVEDVVYIGTDTQYGVRLPGGQKLRVREQNTDPASRPLAQTGEAVNLSFLPQAARVLVE